jgi:hypothetical protein
MAVNKIGVVSDWLKAGPAFKATPHDLLLKAIAMSHLAAVKPQTCPRPHGWASLADSTAGLK